MYVASFLEGHNGQTMFLDEKFLSSNTLQLHTDAAQLKFIKLNGFIVVFQKNGNI